MIKIISTTATLLLLLATVQSSSPGRHRYTLQLTEEEWASCLETQASIAQANLLEEVNANLMVMQTEDRKEIDKLKSQCIHQDMMVNTLNKQVGRLYAENKQFREQIDRYLPAPQELVESKAEAERLREVIRTMGKKQDALEQQIRSDRIARDQLIKEYETVKKGLVNNLLSATESLAKKQRPDDSEHQAMVKSVASALRNALKEHTRGTGLVRGVSQGEEDRLPKALPLSIAIKGYNHD